MLSVCKQVKTENRRREDRCALKIYKYCMQQSISSVENANLDMRMRNNTSS